MTHGLPAVWELLRRNRNQAEGPLLDYGSLGDIPSFVDIEHVDSDYWLVSSPSEKSRAERMMQNNAVAAPEQRPSFTGC